MVSLINSLRQEAVQIGAWVEKNGGLFDAVIGHLIPYDKVCFYEVKKRSVEDELQLNFACWLQDNSECILNPQIEEYQVIIKPLNDRAVSIIGDSLECGSITDLVRKCLLKVPQWHRLYAHWNFNEYKIIPFGKLTECLTENQKKWLAMVDKCKCCRQNLNNKIMDTVLLECDHMVHSNCFTRLKECPECMKKVSSDAEKIWYAKYHKEVLKMSEPTLE